MKKIILILTLAAMISTGGGIAYAFDVSDIIGVIGGGFLVETIADPLNDFIN
ncbi:MAG: hypothetical protein H5T90_08235, partial [Acetomicrobium sp.]|nr:hypothetical protein [Acetomicrobium sp.]